MPLFTDYRDLILEASSSRFAEERLRENKVFHSEGHLRLAGVDEVGRGCLAGPVTSALVSIPLSSVEKFKKLGINDSKKVLPKKRMSLFFEIVRSPDVLCLIDSRDSREIDYYNILQASLNSFSSLIEKSIAALKIDLFLIDGNQLPELSYETNCQTRLMALKSGDQRSLNIAAASIVAKVFRDSMMEKYEELYPGYGFSSNKGYGSKTHLEGIRKLGITPIHRKSFAPCKPGYFDKSIGGDPS